MSFQFPLALTDFFDGLASVETTFTLPIVTAGLLTGGGEQVTIEQGARLWTGRVAVRPEPYADMEAVEARCELLLGADASFFVTSKVRRGPIADPTGALLGGAVPTIGAIDVGRRDIDIAGLPAGYVLTTGDRLSFPYMSGGVMRYALHRVQQGGTAGADGVLAGVEVTAAVRAGAIGGEAITLVNPFCKAKIVRGSYRPPSQGLAVADGLSFAWGQTLR